MPTPSLGVTIRETRNDIARLMRYRLESSSLNPVFQYLISELLILRLMAILESAIDELACKLVAGASYMNGAQPNRLQDAKSIADAKAIILTSRKNKNSRYLTWTTATFISDNVCNTLSQTEPFLSYAWAHANILDEMRKVRNYVAHNSLHAKAEFQQVVRATYGATPSLQIGAFLTSTTRRTTAKIDQYIHTVPIIVSDLSRG